MATTSTAPSRSEPSTFPTATSMKSDCRKMWRLIVIPSGRVAWTSSSVASRRRVSSSVFAPGCFWMPSTTAGFPSWDPSPIFKAGPIITSPSWRTSTGCLPRIATTVSPMSEGCRMRPSPWIRYCCPPST